MTEAINSILISEAQCKMKSYSNMQKIIEPQLLWKEEKKCKSEGAIVDS